MTNYARERLKNRINVIAYRSNLSNLNSADTFPPHDAARNHDSESLPCRLGFPRYCRSSK